MGRHEPRCSLYISPHQPLSMAIGQVETACRGVPIRVNKQKSIFGDLLDTSGKRWEIRPINVDGILPQPPHGVSACNPLTQQLDFLLDGLTWHNHTAIGALDKLEFFCYAFEGV